VAAQLQQWSNAAFNTAYSDDVLFVPTRNTSSTTNKLFALKAMDGTVLWSFNGTIGSYSVDYIVGMPWVDYARNYVYVVSRAGTSGTQPSLWVLNSLTGALVTSFALGHIEASPTLSVDGKTLYVVTTSGNLYAVDMSTLAYKWTGTHYAALGTAVQGFIWENRDIPGRLYFGTANGYVWSLQDPGAAAPPNPASPLWKTAVASPSTPLPMDKLYVGSSDGKVHQLHLTSGVDEKQFTVGPGTYQVGDVSTETGNEIFVPTTEGTLYKLPLPLP
jgi:outer membrane protein assembly factor BamB